MKKVRKAIIPAAGLGTRFLPATKALAKEMLQIVDKPTIQFIVEEALASGIEDILIITGKGKRPIEDHFDSNIEFETNLKEKGKNDLLKLVEEDLIAERIAIMVYRELIEWFGTHDPTTRRMLEEILKDEEDHADDLSDLLNIA